MKEALPAAVDQIIPELTDRFGALEIHRGEVTFPGGGYSLQLPEGYYALTGEDAAWVTTTIWGNLPDPDLDALIFQGGNSPLDDGWAVVVEDISDGHITDFEANTLDFNEIITSAQSRVEEDNKQRKAQGLATVTVVGIAGTPGYDPSRRALKFAKLLQFEGVEGRTLNSQIWVLSRHGFVLFNVLGTEAQVAEIDAKAPELIGMVKLAEGNRHEDYVPGVDAAAEGGLTGLLGGGVAQVALVGVALALLKKFGVLLVLPVVWLFRRLRGRNTGA